MVSFVPKEAGTVFELPPALLRPRTPSRLNNGEVRDAFLATLVGYGLVAAVWLAVAALI